MLGSQCAEVIQETYGDRIPTHPFVVGAHDLRADWTLEVPGEHNRYNAALAMEAARALEIDEESIQKGLESFTGVPGRLELVREVNGVKIYNDTNATTPDATIAALEALDTGEKNIVLLAGGADKGLDMSALVRDIPTCVKRVILLSGTGTDRILGELADASVYADLESALREAVSYAAPGDAVLFSPAFASFGMFKNEYDRGDQFNTLVKNL